MDNTACTILNASTASGYHGTTTSGSVPIMYERRKSETESDKYIIGGLLIGINDSHNIDRMAASQNYRAALLWLGY